MFGCKEYNQSNLGVDHLVGAEELMLLNCGVGEDSTCEDHQMVDTETRLIIFFAAKDREVLYIQKKQDRELMFIRS